MLKYVETQISFSEVPEEITLCINISGCPIHCVGCHSPHLWQDIGEELKPVALSNMIARNAGITCIAFMGGDASPDEISRLAEWVKNNTELKVCWYSGREIVEDTSPLKHIDYYKTGPYIQDKGGLDNPNTNQRFYQVIYIPGFMPKLNDITYKFRNNETNNKSESVD